MASKVLSKIVLTMIQAGLDSSLRNVHAGFRKSEESSIRCSSSEISWNKSTLP
ncbi:hypothetical protein DPMN_034767 [Dreissena polymorpha]|uniref:Uncharacterized protein n=1 Tax=Dreissena polymorpha TaxID=45954 RepID=A0A9D4RMA7_DREPO|nr:hypothetical protein DPMN_034767 [Dreissena polymorpha]